MKDKQSGAPLIMTKITLLDEQDGTTTDSWVSEEYPKGFNPKLVSKVQGTRIVATFKTTNFDGKKETKLDTISPA